MIFGNLEHSKKAAGLYPELLAKGLAFLCDTDFGQLANGKYLLQGEELFVTISEYETEVKEHRRPEAHREYVDIQFLLAGQERIGFSPLGERLEEIEPYSTEQDIVFFKQVEQEQFIEMIPGCYAVFFPWDVHRPGCQAQTKQKVRKVVVKIKYSAMAS